MTDNDPDNRYPPNDRFPSESNIGWGVIAAIGIVALLLAVTMTANNTDRSTTARTSQVEQRETPTPAPAQPAPKTVPNP